MRRIEYNIRKGNEYLQAIVCKAGETDPEKMIQKYSIYRYDAAPIPKAETARQIIQVLAKDKQDTWYIERFDKYTLRKITVWEARAI